MSGLGVGGLGTQAGSSAPPVVPAYGAAIDGQPFRICASDEVCNAPPVRAWGSEPVGSDYRKTWDAVAVRLGTQNPIQIIAEIERQIAAAGPAVAPPPPSATQPPPASTPPKPSQEGFGSFVDGLVKGDFSDNDSWSKTGGQVLGGLIPGYGQVADIRDTAAAISDIKNGKPGAWVNFGGALLGWAPGIGDLAKAMIKGGGKLADAGGEVAEAVAKRGDNVAETVVREQIVLTGGKKGAWNKELNNPLKANADYLVNGYLYKTDHLGRVTSVEGKLDLAVAARNGYQQAKAGGADRLPDDQGGHLIASIFNGPGERLNLVPMNGNLNQGPWRTMESRLAEAAAAGKDVQVKIEVIYEGNTGRPAGFSVLQVVDGVPRTQFFDNVAGGKL